MRKGGYEMEKKSRERLISGIVTWRNHTFLRFFSPFHVE